MAARPPDLPAIQGRLRWPLALPYWARWLPPNRSICSLANTISRFSTRIFIAAGGAFTAGVGSNSFSLSTSSATASFAQFDQHVSLSGGATTVAFSNGSGGFFEVLIDDVSLILLAQNALTPQLPQGAPLNAVNVAAGIDNFINNGGLFPGAFQQLSFLSGQQLVNALLQLDGEVSTDAEKGAFQLMNQFLGLMLDPFVDGRFGAGTSSFAPDREASLPPDIAMAYASILKAPPKVVDNRWSVWGTGFGGTSHTNGDPNVGSSDVTANTYGFASGADYHFTRDTLVGFALAGAGTNWGLSQFLGNGRSDAFQPASTARRRGARSISPQRWPTPRTGSPPTELRWAISSPPSSTARAMAGVSRAAIALSSRRAPASSRFRLMVRSRRSRSTRRTTAKPT
jgi:hypothetical protein